MTDKMFKVTAAVIEKDGKVLIARRRQGDRHGGKWEFPGGKIDQGETPQGCLKRELKEELDIDAEIGGLLCVSEFKYMLVPLELQVYKARHISGKFKALEHDELRWVSPSELDKYDFAKADRDVVKRLMNEISDGKRCR